MRFLLVILLATGGMAGAGTLFFGAYPDSVLAFDEATGKVVDRIKLETGLPTSLRLSLDRKTIFVTTNTKSGIEVIDVGTRKVLKKFTLNTDTHHYRFTGGTPDASVFDAFGLSLALDRNNQQVRVRRSARAPSRKTTTHNNWSLMRP